MSTIYRVEYIVLNENTLGYINDACGTVGVLCGSVLKGGHDSMSGPVSIGTSTMRRATNQDFDDYRCKPPRGYSDINVPQYKTGYRPDGLELNQKNDNGAYETVGYFDSTRQLINFVLDSWRYQQ